MNILSINAVDTRGGAAKVAYQLKKSLESFGHTANMLVSQKFSQDSGVFILNDRRSLGQRIRRKLAYYLANDIDPFNSDKLLRTKEFREADIVHCHNLHSYYFNLNTLPKISMIKPVVWTFHDMWPITSHCAHSFDGKSENGFFQCPSLDIYPPIAWHNERYLENSKRKIYEKSRFHIVAPSLWLKMKVEGSMLAGKPCSLIYNGVDTELFKPREKKEIRNKLNLPQNRKIVLSVIKGGKNNPWKGNDYVSNIIGNWREKADVLFICIGGGNIGKNVINLPFADSNALIDYYSAADVLLYPSIADNCPLVPLEAQACGLPVVAFNTGGIPEIIEDKKTGFIADYKNSSELIRGLEYVLSLSPGEYDHMSRAALLRIKNRFSMDDIVEQYIRLYETVLAQFADSDQQATG